MLRKLRFGSRSRVSVQRVARVVHPRHVNSTSVYVYQQRATHNIRTTHTINVLKRFYTTSSATSIESDVTQTLANGNNAINDSADIVNFHTAISRGDIQAAEEALLRMPAPKATIFMRLFHLYASPDANGLPRQLQKVIQVYMAQKKYDASPLVLMLICSGAQRLPPKEIPTATLVKLWKECLASRPFSAITVQETLILLLARAQAHSSVLQVFELSNEHKVQPTGVVLAHVVNSKIKLSHSVESIMAVADLATESKCEAPINLYTLMMRLCIANQMIEKAIEYAAKGEQVIHGLPAHYQAYFEYYASLCGIRGDKQKLEEIINMARSRLNRPELDVEMLMRLRYYASAKNWAEVIRIWRELNTENKQFSLISSVDDTVTEKRVLAASLLREVAQAYRFGSADKERARQELQTLFDYAAKHKLLTYLSTRLVSLLFFALDNSREDVPWAELVTQAKQKFGLPVRLQVCREGLIEYLIEDAPTISRVKDLLQTMLLTRIFVPLKSSIKVLRFLIKNDLMKEAEGFFFLCKVVPQFKQVGIQLLRNELEHENIPNDRKQKLETWISSLLQNSES